MVHSMGGFRTRPVLASLHDFVSAGLRPRTTLAKAIVLMLGIKCVFLIAMSIYLGASDQRQIVDSNTISVVIGPAPTPAH